MFNISVPVSWYLAGVLGVAVAISGAGWAHTSNKLKDERAAHQETKTQHEQIVQGFVDAQAEANRKAELKRQEIEKEAKRNAEQADQRYNNLYSKYRSNLLRYQQANPGDRSEPNRSELPTPEGSDRSGGSPEVPTIVITFSDAEVCAINTARLQSVRDWALQLKEKAP